MALAVTGVITGRVERVIVGVDDSAAGLAALAEATKLARSYGASLVAVRAWALGLPRHGGRRMRHLSHPHVVLSFSGAEQDMAASVLVRQAFRAALGRLPSDLPVTIRTPAADPAVALLSIASQPGDVLVLGSGGDRSARRLIHGSVSRYCARRAGCPVLLVPVRETGRAAGTPRSASP
jgi:nucleotide-binding universal stress UspA family protein